MSELARKIALEVYIGQAMQGHYGIEIAVMYRAGKSQREIFGELCLNHAYGVNECIAHRALGFAIRGYEPPEKCRMHLPAYEGLINRKELKYLSEKHRLNAGNLMKEKGIGIHGLSREELADAGRKSGKKQYKNKSGIHAQSHQEKIEAGRASAEKRGLVLWTDKEINDAIELRKQYKIREVADLLNSMHHSFNDVRTSKAVRIAIYKAVKRGA